MNFTTVLIPVTCEKCGHTTPYHKPEVFRPSAEGAVIRDIGITPPTGSDRTTQRLRVFTDRGTMVVEWTPDGLALSTEEP